MSGRGSGDAARILSNASAAQSSSKLSIGWIAGGRVPADKLPSSQVVSIGRHKVDFMPGSSLLKQAAVVGWCSQAADRLISPTKISKQR